MTLKVILNCVKKFINRPEGFFVVVAAVAGLLFIIITPPFQAPDEPLHFYRAYQISTFNLAPDPLKNITQTRYAWGNNSLLGGGLLPDSLGKTVELTMEPRKDTVMRVDRYNVREALGIHTDVSKLQTYETTSAMFSPVMYAPQSFVIFLGRNFDAPPIILMYLGRLAVLTTWIVLYGLAVKYVPRKKWAVAVGGLLPMAIFQAASLGGDGITIGSSVLFIAFILYLRESKKITNYHIILLLFLGSLLLLTKSISGIFIFLALLLPNQRLSSSKRIAYIKKVALVIIPIIPYFLWAHITRGLNTKSIALAPGYPDTAMQTQLLLNNPLRFLNALINTYFSVDSDKIWHSFMGLFGTLDSKLPETFIVIGFVGLSLLIFGNTKDAAKEWLTRTQKRVILLLTGLYWLGANLAMYINATPPGASKIVGLQGRYFLPLILPLAVIFYNQRIRIDGRLYKTIAIVLPIILLIASLITIWQSYYSVRIVTG